jgi:hypothetical protein
MTVVDGDSPCLGWWQGYLRNMYSAPKESIMVGETGNGSATTHTTSVWQRGNRRKPAA